MTFQTMYIYPKALRIGIFVRLEMAWASHPFSFNNFLIKDLDQVRKLQALGLERVLCDVERSDVGVLQTAVAQTMELDAIGATASTPTDGSAEASSLADTSMASDLAAKRDRLEGLKAQMALLASAEKSFSAAAREMNLVTQNVFAQPADSVRRTAAVVEDMLSAMTMMESVQLHLMNNKLNSKDVFDHELNVASMALLLGKRLGLAVDELRNLGLACLFHDIGKRELADSLTRKLGNLTQIERNAMQQHVHHGVAVTLGLQLAKPVMLTIAQHHEMADGSGFPNRLTLPAMVRGAQVLSLVNSFDNLCNPPHAMAGMTPHEALKILFARDRKRYAPDALAAFIKMMGIYPPGTLVKLSDESDGLVLSVNPDQALRPTVLIHEPGATRADLIIVDLATEPSLNVARGMQRQELSMEAAVYLNPRRRISFFASDGN